MDLSPTVEQAGFRQECREWLQANLDWEYGVGFPPQFDDLADEVEYLRGWQRRLADAGYVGVTWPAEYGGRDAGPLHHYILQEELARARAPELVGRIGVNLVGHTLLAHGTDEQKARWLPDILNARQLVCQLFSEPDAGSDLASLTTRAVAVDGGWKLYGQKVWTSYAQFADWGLCLARSDSNAPKRRGISMFMVDMSAEGVDVLPLRQITDESDFNEVFFDGVFVSQDQLIGPLDGGWGLASSTLNHERGTNPRQLVIHSQLLEELFALAAQRGLLDDANTQQDLAQAFVELRLFQLQNWRALSCVQHGREPGAETATAKLYWSEMSQRLHRCAMQVLGDEAPLLRGAVDIPADGRWQRSWLYYLASSIFAGTNEIQRNIIAERTLGLPLEPVTANEAK
ncbi:MAG: acyl-CoA dehydrogenase [Acidimicrobiaceae bacterium]|nr:acyl-CoA dehydrogenase [Acidimicrobiaceae bacterium]MYD07038.1 acyl-CoA dehydrogenase [Acidimicrobiaceae bacterium]MYI58178.1 acyl-CoA dehydrogenase [Acidimicrobiaceae bacterium]